MKMALKVRTVSNLAITSESDLGYSYCPLHFRTSIRLLYVRSITHGVIVCNLKTVDLDDKPTYRCLSYTWGDPFGRDIEQKRLPLQCDNRYILITENLHNALCQLWAIGKYNLNAIWIDAICINQKDLAERAQQVNIMQRIFEGAVQATAWLGPEDEDSRCVVEILWLLELYLERHPAYVQQIDTQLFRHSKLAEYQRWLNMTPDRAGRSLRFLKRAYFRRVWIIQELVVAKTIRMFCGSTELSTTTLYHLSRLLDPILLRFIHTAAPRRPTLDPKNTLDKDGFILIGLLRRRYLEQRGSEQTPLMPSAMSLLNRLIGKNFEATDDRDIVYSLKGILNDLDDIAVDYKCDTVDLFELLATKFIQESGNLDVLAQASSQHRGAVRNNTTEGKSRHTVGVQQRAWPSWVPDFASQSRAPSFDSTFNASGDIPMVFWKGDSPHKLHLHGLQVGRIQTRSENAEEVQSGLMKQLLRILSEMPHIYMTTGEYRENVFFRALIGFAIENDARTNPSKVATWLCASIAHVKHLLKIAFWSDSNSCESERKMDFLETIGTVENLQRDDTFRLFPSAEQVEAMLSEMESSYSNLEAMITSHPNLRSDPADLLRHMHVMPAEVDPMASSGLDRNCVFYSDSGHLGSSSDTIQSGDVIWILNGSEVPYVLRPIDSRAFHLIAPAYVHGVMHGEAVSGKKGLKLEHIDLE